MNRIVHALSALAILAVASPVFAQDTMPADKDAGVIELQGVGEISVAPDMATVSSGVVTEAKTARDALTANTEAMTKLVAVLKEAGIEERDIQTSGFSVQPQYSQSYRSSDSGAPKAPQIVSYRVFNTVTMLVRDLDTLGTVLDRAVTVGANTINNVSFASSEAEDLRNQARERAMKNAMDKAALYAGAAGIELGRILHIAEYGSPSPRPMQMGMRADMVLAESAPVPVQAGELTFQASVQVRWQIAE